MTIISSPRGITIDDAPRTWITLEEAVEGREGRKVESVNKVDLGGRGRYGFNLDEDDGGEDIG